MVFRLLCQQVPLARKNFPPCLLPKHSPHATPTFRIHKAILCANPLVPLSRIFSEMNQSDQRAVALPPKCGLSWICLRTHPGVACIEPKTHPQHHYRQTATWLLPGVTWTPCDVSCMGSCGGCLASMSRLIWVIPAAAQSLGVPQDDLIERDHCRPGK